MDDTNMVIGDTSVRLGDKLWKSSSDFDISVYILNVRDDYKPKLGQEFALLVDVREFYNRYAKEDGFSVRSNSTKKNRDTNKIVRKEYMYSKEGQTSKKAVCEGKRRRGIVREGCNAKLVMVKSKNDAYTVTVFGEEHSHPLTTPQRVHLLRSQAKKSFS
ncbi:hypothetical protein LWI29_003934 [Acer saccharum]|uniref:FAR1 domain-containing protein n=1 Tax=Acer saccharum TaxID=4024 RepID=A0AA39VK50_ACESA|nr:hypothetical protein LWI29_003934 [Acer saccharum]